MTLAPFATWEAIATRLGRGSDFTANEQAQADAFLDDASWLIRDYCRQDINAQTDLTFTVESPEGPWLNIPQRPVTRIASVEVNGQVVDGWSQVGDRLYRVYGWRWPSVDTIPPLAIYGLMSTATVTYDAGYDPIPQVIATVCVNAAMRAFDNPTGDLRESVDDYTRDKSRGFQGDQPTGVGVFLDLADQRRLRRYRRSAFMLPMGSGFLAS